MSFSIFFLKKIQKKLAGAQEVARAGSAGVSGGVASTFSAGAARGREVCLLLQGFGCQSWQPQRVRRVVSVSEIRISLEERGD